MPDDYLLATFRKTAHVASVLKAGLEAFIGIQVLDPTIKATFGHSDIESKPRTIGSSTGNSLDYPDRCSAALRHSGFLLKHRHYALLAFRICASS